MMSCDRFSSLCRYEINFILFCLFVCFSKLFLLNIREMEKIYSAFDFQVIVPSVLSSSVSVSTLKYRLAVAKNSSKHSNTLNLSPTLDL